MTAGAEKVDPPVPRPLFWKMAPTGNDHVGNLATQSTASGPARAADLEPL